MMRYFFNLHECGTVVEDDDGRELPDLDAAYANAMAEARAIMCAELAEGRLCLSCHIVVADATRKELLRLPFSQAVVVTGIGDSSGEPMTTPSSPPTPR